MQGIPVLKDMGWDLPPSLLQKCIFFLQSEFPHFSSSLQILSSFQANLFWGLACLARCPICLCATKCPCLDSLPLPLPCATVLQGKELQWYLCYYLESFLSVLLYTMSGSHCHKNTKEMGGKNPGFLSAIGLKFGTVGIPREYYNPQSFVQFAWNRMKV